MKLLQIRSQTGFSLKTKVSHIGVASLTSNNLFLVHFRAAVWQQL